MCVILLMIIVKWIDFKCCSLKLKEMYFMKDKDLPEEGLEKAELQLLFFKQSLITTLHK